LESTTLEGKISSGRSVPDGGRERLERGSDPVRKMIYRLTLEFDDIDIIVGDLNRLKAKLVVNCFVAPQINKVNVLLNEFLRLGTSAMLLHNVRFITIIPTTKLVGSHGLRCTGMPVIPHYALNDTAPPAVAIIHSEADTREPSKIIDSFNSLLSHTDQWLNLKHEVIDEFLRGRNHLRRQFDSGSYLRVTETGVEFADVEYLREINAPLFNKLERFGYLLIKQKMGGIDGSSLDEIGLKVKRFIDNNMGPSIVHSEEIRSPYTEFASSTKPITSSLLITRMVLSLLLIVGVGNANGEHVSPPRS
jgi:hypothetical protein